MTGGRRCLQSPTKRMHKPSPAARTKKKGVHVKDEHDEDDGTNTRMPSPSTGDTVTHNEQNKHQEETDVNVGVDDNVNNDHVDSHSTDATEGKDGKDINNNISTAVVSVSPVKSETIQQKSTKSNVNNVNVNVNSDTDTHKNISTAPSNENTENSRQKEKGAEHSNGKEEKEDEGEGIKSKDINHTNANANSNADNADNDANANMETETGPFWEEAFDDANELESLVFCIRRPTARKRLFKLINNLRLLAGKLKRHDEVTQHLHLQNTNVATSTSIDSTTTINNNTHEKESNTNTNTTQTNSSACTSTSNAQQRQIMPNNPTNNSAPATAAGKKRTRGDRVKDSDEDERARKRKQPRAIPLESMTQEEREILESKNGITRKKDAMNNINNTNNANKKNTSSNTNSNTSTSTSTSTTQNNTITTKSKNGEYPMPQSYDPLAKPPLLKLKDNWVHHHNRGSREHCPDFDATNECPLGSKCTHYHIYTPRLPNPKAIIVETQPMNKRGVHKTSEREVDEIFTRDDLERAYETYRNISITKSSLAEKIKNDDKNNPNYSCSFICPIDSTVYYAQPFPGDTQVKANKSKQGIWWYKTMKEAKDAVSTIVIRDLQQREIVPKRRSEFRPKYFDDIHNVSGSGTCSGNGNGNGKIDYGKKKKAVDRAGQRARQALISNEPKCFVIKEKNIGPPILPEIKPCNWMETRYRERCAEFNKPMGCPFGSSCPRAHVYYPKSLNNRQFPRREALASAYMANFGMIVEDPSFQGGGGGGGGGGKNSSTSFHVTTGIDNRGKMWFTAAWKCPREGTIYYAAGGNTGMINKQNMVLYPSMEDAKLAAAGVVLDSFTARGLKGDRNAGGGGGGRNMHMMPPSSMNHNPMAMRTGPGIAAHVHNPTMGIGVPPPPSGPMVGMNIGMGRQPPVQVAPMQTVPPPAPPPRTMQPAHPGSMQPIPIATVTHAPPPPPQHLMGPTRMLAPAPPPPPTRPNMPPFVPVAPGMAPIPPPPPPPPPARNNIGQPNPAGYRDHSYLKSFA